MLDPRSKTTLPSLLATTAALLLGGGANAQLSVHDTDLLFVTDSSDGAHLGTALATGDFDGDGHDDVAMGLPGWERPPDHPESGRVSIRFGSDDGLTHNLFGQNLVAPFTFGFEHDRFGSSLASGDFNNDGYDDLAVGSPEFDGGGQTNRGRIDVFYGSSIGLDERDGFGPGANGLPGDPDTEDRFGHALAAGDFNGDGYDDLAVGAPNEDVGLIEDAGAVFILFGGPTGVTETGAVFLHQDTPGVADVTEGGDRFGAALAAGNLFTAGGTTCDLIVGAPGETLPNGTGAGAVHAFYGCPFLFAHQFWHRGVAGVPGNDGAAQLGAALAVGDFDGHFGDDVAMGAPIDTIEGVIGAGAVNILYSDTGGLGTTGAQLLWRQALDGQPGGILDAFGSTLTAGDFDGTGFEDLVIAAPFDEAIPSNPNEGSIFVVSGGPGGLTGSETYDLIDLGHAPESGQQFGLSLAVGNLRGPASSDLLIGIPFRDETWDDAGWVVRAGSESYLFSDGFESGDTSAWQTE